MALFRMVLFVVSIFLAENAVWAGEKPFLVGWASVDVTPPRQVALAGITYIRLSTGVESPLFATALALSAPDGASVVLISCDFRNIPDSLRDGVRAVLKERLPGLPSESVVFNATHSHNAPPLGTFGIGVLGVMDEPEYQAFAIPRIATMVEEAWKARKPGGISFGLGYAVLGQNRLVHYYQDKAKMYGRTDLPDFSHLEGYEDHSVNVLCTWDAERKLTGMVVNVPMPAQAAVKSSISADYWHEARAELRERFGAALYVLPQCSAAGDMAPNILVQKKPEKRLEKLLGLSRNQIIARRIADAVSSLYPVLKENIDWHPVLSHRAEVLQLPGRLVTEAEVEEARKSYAELKAAADAEVKRRQENPELKFDAASLRTLSRANRQLLKVQKVQERYQKQGSEAFASAEVHAIRLGEMAMVFNPFELYVDYGIQIKARSTAEQTFVVQLAGGGTYLPTQRGIQGGAYGADPASNRVGPEGGKALVEWSVKAINEMWQNDAAKP